MEGLEHNRFIWSGPDALWGLSFFSRLSIPLAEIWMSAILVYGLDVWIWLTPESCIFCRVIWAMAFRDEGGFRAANGVEKLLLVEGISLICICSECLSTSL